MFNNTMPVTVAVVCTFILLMTIGIIISNYSTPDSERTFEVIEVSTYYQPSGFTTSSNDGYIIKYLDNSEICTLKISSDELTVRQTDNESYLIRTHTYQPISRYEYKLYWGR